MEMEYKSLPFEVKAIEEDGTFEGYGAAFGSVDFWGDIIKPGAFKKSMAAHKKAGTMPAMLWQHRHDKPLGPWLNIHEDEKGLWAKGQLLKDEVQQAKEAFALLRTKSISGMSIGYLARDYSIDEKTGIRTLRQVDLGEISLVTFPANEDARVTSVKAAGIKTIRDFEAALRDVMGFSVGEAKRIASHGFKAREVPDESAEVCAIVAQFKHKYGG
jgi:HK97 family phage prohead protease